jgi:hypothetical protein
MILYTIGECKQSQDTVKNGKGRKMFEHYLYDKSSPIQRDSSFRLNWSDKKLRAFSLFNAEK